MASGPRWLALMLSLLLSCPLAGAAAPSCSTAISARVSETHGTVFKRGFVDWEKEQWSDPEPARTGDNLAEGMQVGTGDKSWAEVTWPNVTTRAWANSVFAVAPNQRLVYLLGGQMLFNLDKHRKDKKDFFVWTKVLQARIRGTTVMVQCTNEVSRITVLEGVVEVMNRLDRSVIKVNPGVVYEIRTPGTQLPPNISQAPSTEKASPQTTIAEDIVETTDETVNDQIPLRLADQPLPKIAENLKDAAFHDELGAIENASYDGGVKVKPKFLLSDFEEITAPGQAPIVAFVDNQADTKLYPANAGGLLRHPLVNGFGTRLPSLALVQMSLNNFLNLPPPNNLPPLNNITGSLPNPELNGPLLTMATDTITGVVDTANITNSLPATFIQNAEILRVPSTDQYLVGPLIGHALPLPAQALNGLMPIGVLNGPTADMASTLTTANLHPQGQPVTNIMTNMVPPQTGPQTGTFIPPNMPNVGSFIPPTAPLPTVTNFVPPTTNMPNITNFVPPTAPITQITNFVPPTTSVPQMTNFVPTTPMVPQMTNIVPPTMTMPVVNTFVPPTTSFTNTTVNTGGSINISAPVNTGSFSSGISLPSGGLPILK